MARYGCGYLSAAQVINGVVSLPALKIYIIDATIWKVFGFNKVSHIFPPGS